MSKKKRTFTLARLFIITTAIAVWLAFGRLVGFAGAALFVVAPFPYVGYLGFVHLLMRRYEIDYQSRSCLVNILLSVGLLIALLASVVLLALAFVCLMEHMAGMFVRRE